MTSIRFTDEQVQTLRSTRGSNPSRPSAFRSLRVSWTSPSPSIPSGERGRPRIKALTKGASPDRRRRSGNPGRRSDSSHVPVYSDKRCLAIVRTQEIPFESDDLPVDARRGAVGASRRWIFFWARQGRGSPQEALNARGNRRGDRGLRRLLQQLEAAGRPGQDAAFGIQGLPAGQDNLPSHPRFSTDGLF